MSLKNRRIIAIKEAVEPTLLRLRGVHGVGLGQKYICGKPRGEQAIVVFVWKKLPLAQIPPEEVVPTAYRGVRTDVVELAPMTAANNGRDYRFDNCPAGQITAVTQQRPITFTSNDHGLETDDEVRIIGVDDIDWSIAYRVGQSTADTFVLPDIDPGDLYNGQTGHWRRLCAWDEIWSASGRVLDATATDPVEITTDGLGQPDRLRLRKGDRVRFVGVGGMTELNRREHFTVGSVKEPTFTLRDVDGSTFHQFSQGGRWLKLCMVRTGRITAIDNRDPMIVTSPSHGLSDRDQIAIVGIRGLAPRGSEPAINSHETRYEVARVDQDRFKLLPSTESCQGKTVASKAPPIDGTKYEAYLGGGVWAQVMEDRNRYRPLQGGVRIELYGKKKTTLNPPKAVTSGALVTTSSSSPVTVRVEEKCSVGTLGCFALHQKTGKHVLLSNYHVLYGASGVRDVHHPYHYVSSKTCSSHKIASVLDGRISKGTTEATAGVLDAAVAGLESDEKFLPEIVDIGPIRGTATVSVAEIDSGQYRVWKRGAVTHLTEGVIRTCLTTFISDGVYYKDQLCIEPAHGNLSAGGGRSIAGVFSLRGDSGSVVVNDKNEVVGLLHGVQGDGWSLASPIAAVETELGIQICAESGSRKCSGPNVAQSGPLITVGIPELIADASEELLQTEVGSQFAGLAQRHVNEVRSLIDTNETVAAAWHRQGGPTILRELRRMVEVRDQPMPELIFGLPLRDRMRKFFDTLRRYASAELTGDLQRYTSSLEAMLGLTYSQLLEVLNQGLPRPSNSA